MDQATTSGTHNDELTELWIATALQHLPAPCFGFIVRNFTLLVYSHQCSICPQQAAQ